MTDSQVWLVTGAARGMGVDIVRAALDAGHQVVATARDAERVHEVFGEQPNLLAAALDVTDRDAAKAAVDTAVSHFGRLDVVVNNAGAFHAGFFEEMPEADFRAQIESTMFGPMNVIRAALPVMRSQRSGLLVVISSTAGVMSEGVFGTAYATSKFGIEGFMEGLAPEVEPFGIKTMIVEPGFFRTELLTEQSSRYAPPSIDDYADRTASTIEAWQAMNGKQGGDPAKLAAALVELTSLDAPPFRIPMGADAVNCLERKAAWLLESANTRRDLTEHLALDQE